MDDEQPTRDEKSPFFKITYQLTVQRRRFLIFLILIRLPLGLETLYLGHRLYW